MTEANWQPMSIFYLHLRRRQLFTRLSEQSDVSSTVGKVMMKTVHKRLVNNQQVQKRRLVALPPQQEVWKSCGGESSAYTFVRKEGTPKSTGASSLFRINVPFGRYTSMLRCYAATVRRRNHRHQWERSLSSSTSNCTRISLPNLGTLGRHPPKTSKSPSGWTNHIKFCLYHPSNLMVESCRNTANFQSHHRIHLKEPPCLAKMQTFHQGFVWVVFFA